MYILNKDDMKRVDRQVNDIAEGNEKAIDFKKGTIALLNNPHKCYKIWFAEREVEVCCSTLINSGFCASPDLCDMCELTRKLEEARSEIKRGIRRKAFINRGCKMHIDFNEDGSIRRITQVLR